MMEFGQEKVVEKEANFNHIISVLLKVKQYLYLMYIMRWKIKENSLYVRSRYNKRKMTETKVNKYVVRPGMENFENFAKMQTWFQCERNSSGKPVRDKYTPLNLTFI